MELRYDTNGGDNLCHKSIEQTKFLTPMYENRRKINATYFALAASFRIPDDWHSPQTQLF
jgi:hypothetical protein